MIVNIEEIRIINKRLNEIASHGLENIEWRENNIKMISLNDERVINGLKYMLARNDKLSARDIIEDIDTALCFIDTLKSFGKINK